MIVLLFEALAVSTSYAADAAPSFRDEVSKQAEIYNSRKVPEGYVVGRSLFSYAFTLSPEFRHSLAALDSHDRWLDIGAGEGNAVLDYVSSSYDVILEGAKPGAGKAQVVAMSIEDRRTSRWHEAAAALGDKQLAYLFGKRLREYSAEELGRFTLITDVLGGFSYTRDPSLFMEKTLGALSVNGSFYTLLQDVQPESGGSRPFYSGAPFLTEIVAGDGAQVKLCSWLKSITCVEVTCAFQGQSSPPVERYRVKKVCEGVSVPQLQPTHFQAGTPPERRFLLKNSIREALERTDTAR